MHFLVMCAFAAVIAVVMATIDHERTEPRAKVLYGLRVFGAFLGVGFVLGWLMYFIPF